ncbi:hypothetical protein ACTWQA_32935, partial [Nonomuraea sp. 10N515B]
MIESKDQPHNIRGNVIMSTTQGTAALATTRGSAQEGNRRLGVAAASHHGGENPPSEAAEVPLRELLGDEVLD